MFTIITSLIGILIVVTGLALDAWIPADMKSGYNATSGLWGGFLLLWITALGAFSSKDFLKMNAEWIGSKKPVIARAACIIGMLLALSLIARSVLALLHKI